jgi:hypothetical protein
MFELTQENFALLRHIATGHSNKHKAPCSALVELNCHWFNCLSDLEGDSDEKQPCFGKDQIASNTTIRAHKSNKIESNMINETEDLTFEITNASI